MKSTRSHGAVAPQIPWLSKAMSEVAKLRNDHPHCHIDTVWACAGQTGAGCGHRGRVSRSARGPRNPWLAVSQKKTAG